MTRTASTYVPPAIAPSGPSTVLNLPEWRADRMTIMISPIEGKIWTGFFCYCPGCWLTAAAPKGHRSMESTAPENGFSMVCAGNPVSRAPLAQSIRDSGDETPQIAARPPRGEVHVFVWGR